MRLTTKEFFFFFLVKRGNGEAQTTFCDLGWFHQKTAFEGKKKRAEIENWGPLQMTSGPGGSRHLHVLLLTVTAFLPGTGPTSISDSAQVVLPNWTRLKTITCACPSSRIISDRLIEIREKGSKKKVCLPLNQEKKKKKAMRLSLQSILWILAAYAQN